MQNYHKSILQKIVFTNKQHKVKILISLMKTLFKIKFSFRWKNINNLNTEQKGQNKKNLKERKAKNNFNNY